MSAVAFAAAHAVPEPRAGQPRLFAVEGGAAAETLPVEASHAALTPVPTLVAVVSDRWAALTGGAPAGCLVCGAEMEPRWSAGHGSVGGRCRSCGSSLE